MSRKATENCDASRRGIVHAVLFAAAIALAPGLAWAAAEGNTTTIKRDSDAAKEQVMAEPSYQTREERLKAKPLDWTKTIGKPKRKALSAAENKSLQGAKPEAVAGGAPDPKANEEARRLHPEDWNTQDHTQR